MTTIILVTKAYHRAAIWHVGDKRKGEAQEPYINHLTEVAELVAEATNGEDINLIIAAVLHDAIEDTDVTHDQIAAEFNQDVAGLVAEVTDDTSLPSEERKRLQVEMVPRKSARARMLKIADKTSNLRSIRNSPPTNWSPERKRNYLKWARSVVAGARGQNIYLEIAFDEAASALETLNFGTN